MITYSYPCTSISNAGLQKGLTEGSGTASSLVWECFKIFEAKRPKYLLMENVKALTQKKFMPQFKLLQERLQQLGYTNYWQVCNAKDYGVPQNRERVFMVSILNEHKPYTFPTPFPLTRRLKDILEENVADKYWLTQNGIRWRLLYTAKKQSEGCGFACNFQEENGISGSVVTTFGSRGTDTYLKVPTFGRSKLNEMIQANQINPEETLFIDCYNKLINSEMSNVISTRVSQSNYYFVNDPPKVKQIANIVKEVGFKNPQRGRVYSIEGISPTPNTVGGGGLEAKVALSSSNEIPEDATIVEYYIRKLTPRECFRLMDVDDADIDKLLNTYEEVKLKSGKIRQDKLSDAACYRLAGNSIVCANLYHIFRTMFIDNEPRAEESFPKQKTIFDYLEED